MKLALPFLVAGCLLVAACADTAPTNDPLQGTWRNPANGCLYLVYASGLKKRAPSASFDCPAVILN